MRAYHHFSVRRSTKHLAISFGILLIPLLLLIAFSVVNKLSFLNILSDFGISAGRLFVAFVISLVLGWLAVVLVVNTKIETASVAVLDVLQSLPTFAILPVGVHYFGRGEVTIIFFLVITIIWPIIFSILSSLKQANQSWKDAVTMSRISRSDYLRYYLLPVTAPGIMTGTIIGLGEGWEALIGMELLINAENGLGPFFGSFSNNSTMTLFGVLIFLSIIFTLNKFIWLPLLEKSHRLMEE